MFEWPYFTLQADGLLKDENGHKPFRFPSDDAPAQPRFTDAWEAEAWLQQHDLRGSVQ